MFTLDHFFVLTDSGAPVADQLIAAGLREGKPNTHLGQGTSNRRFFFINTMLELLWVHDREEAKQGPGHRMKMAERAEATNACPFGLVFRPKGKFKHRLPFQGWRYEPDYLSPPDYFHIAINSDLITEPLLVFAPFLCERGVSCAEGNNGHVINVRVSNPESEPSAELVAATSTSGVSLVSGESHLLEVYCENQNISSIDLRPNLPLVIHA